MKRKLEEQGIENCEVMPNFKRLSIASVDISKQRFSEVSDPGRVY